MNKRGSVPAKLTVVLLKTPEAGVKSEYSHDVDLFHDGGS